MRGLLILIQFCIVSATFAQDNNAYLSDADKLITVRSVALLPVFDNLQGIYSRPVENHLVERLKSNHRWEYMDVNVAGPLLTPDELEENQGTLTSAMNGTMADALIAVSIIKGPAGVGIKMNLFLKSDNKLIAREVVTGYQRFDVDALKRRTDEMMEKLFANLPYSGILLSRQGTRVTVNLGRKDGVKAGDDLNVIQVIKLKRHPKFDFLVSSQKSIIGKIKLTKVDESLSFGRIVTETEAGAIQKLAKIALLNPVNYPEASSYTESSEGPAGLSQNADGKLNYGENPTEWLPRRNPTFGMVGARLGLGKFQENVKSSDSWDASAPFYPTIAIDAELWLTPVWSMHTSIRQGIITTDNPVSGGSPSDLSHSLSAYDFLFGYNIRLGNIMSSPKIEILGGYGTYRLFVDESDPPGLTTKQYSGIKLGVSGSYPVTNEPMPYSLGANLNFVFNAKLKESGGDSGSSDNTINQFGFFVDKPVSINLKARGTMEFELYSSDFSGGSATSSSQRHTTLTAGLYYLF